MPISYAPLWEHMKHNKLNKTYLRDRGIHPTTIAKMSKDETVAMDVLIKLCSILNCDIKDIIKYVADPIAEEVNLQTSIVKGDVYFADLSIGIGSEAAGVRPVIIVQNNKANRFSPTVIVVPLSTRRESNIFPTHVPITPSERNRIQENVTAHIEQVQTISKERLQHKMGAVTFEELRAIDKALLTALDIVV